jgi:hypothetical protein
MACRDDGLAWLDLVKEISRKVGMVLANVSNSFG